VAARTRSRTAASDACLVHGILVVGVVVICEDQRLLERASTHHRLALRASVGLDAPRARSS
jgi:hypothetical protein